MAKPPIGLGVIGVNRSNMGSTVSLLRDVPDLRYELRAICAARAEPLAALAREWGVPFHTTDYRALVERPEVEVVAVYSPDHLHAGTRSSGTCATSRSAWTRTGSRRRELWTERRR